MLEMENNFNGCFLIKLIHNLRISKSIRVPKQSEFRMQIFENGFEIRCHLFVEYSPSKYVLRITSFEVNLTHSSSLKYEEENFTPSK